MALTPLRETLEKTGTAFDNKLNQLVGLAESVKAGELRKQQMAEQLEQKKDLIQYRSDVQLEQKKEYYQDVIQPQNEAERQAEQAQQYVEQLRKSRQDAQDTLSAFEKRKAESKNRSMVRYNLDQFDYDVSAQTDDDGKVTGYKPEVYYDGEKIPTLKFDSVVSELSVFGDRLKAVEDSETTTKTYRDEDGRLHLGNDERGEEIISQIKSDAGGARMKYYSAFKDGDLKVSNQTPEGVSGTGGGGETAQSILNEMMPIFTSLRENIDDEGKMNVKIADKYIVDNWSFLGIGEDTEKVDTNINFKTTIGNVQRQINNVVKQTVPQAKDIDIATFSDKEKRMIVQGKVNDEELEKVPEERANAVRHMAGLDEQTRQKYQELFQYYNSYEKAYQQYIRTGEGASRNEYMLDLWGAPQNVSNEADFKKLLKHQDDFARGQSMLDFSQQYLPNDPNQKFLNK